MDIDIAGDDAFHLREVRLRKEFDPQQVRSIHRYMVASAQFGGIDARHFRQVIAAKRRSTGA